MNLYANQFPQHVSRHGLPPFILIFGEEPQQRNDCIGVVRNLAKQQGYDERQSFSADSQFNWQSVVDDGMSMSLFSSKKLVEIELPEGKPGASGSKVLLNLAEQVADDTIYLLHGGKIGKDVQNAKWFKTLDKLGISTICYQLEGKRLEQWLMQKFQERNKQAEPQAIALIAAFSEGNLLAAAQTVEKLCLLETHQHISLEQAKAHVADNTKFSVFQFTDTLLQGDATRAIKMLNRLEAEGTEPNQILWFLIKEAQLLLSLKSEQLRGQSLTAAFNAQRIWKSKQSLYISALQRLDIESLMALTDKLAELDIALKSSVICRPFVELSHVGLLFCGYPLHQLPLNIE